MGLLKKQFIYTVEEYLAIEASSAERHEYLDGEIVAMAGESPAHAKMSSNLHVLLGSQLWDRPCDVLSKDTKIRSGPDSRGRRVYAGMFSYPDLAVVCGEWLFVDENSHVVVNPTVLIEVLSPSTEEFDRGEKAARYRLWNRTLRDYLLVSQDRPRIEHCCRDEAGEWASIEHLGMETVVALPSIGCSLKLADVYHRVQFTPEGVE